MKKALVVEASDNYIVTLDNKGKFKKIKNKMNLKIGDEYEKSEGISVKKGIVFATSLALLLGMGGFGYSYATPTDYLTLDINPSIKLTTNRYNKVLEVESLNSDGEAISKDLKVKNKSVKDAIKLLVESATDNGYIVKNDDNAVMITSTSDEVLNDAEVGVEEGLKEEEIVNTEVIKENINKERFEEAERLGISPGKVNLIQKLQAVSPDVTLDEYSNAPVKDIMKKIKEQRVINKEENKTEENNSQNKEENINNEEQEKAIEKKEENKSKENSSNSKEKINENANSNSQKNDNNEKKEQDRENKSEVNNNKPEDKKPSKNNN
ncbi:hypothetical protein ACH36K_06065 [Clostridium sp. MB05]|uniref:anti-sigma-I factor RsgI family protein n=1 Tax=Clostridium sp. MB05 TaxID=3376682 RepID=UPI003981ECE1